MLPITFTPVTQKPPALLPTGYQVRTVRKWGDPIMVAQGGFSINGRYGDPTIAIGTFEVIDLYIAEQGVWVGSWGSVSNFNRLSAADMVLIAKAQLKAFGRAELDPIKDMTVNLDGYTLKQKMAWMYQANWTGGPPGLTMWGAGDWYETGEKRYGTMVCGGEQVAVSNIVELVNSELPGETQKRSVKMRKLLDFKRVDFSKDPRVYPWLWNRATCVYHNDRFSVSTPKGIIYLPVALNANEFDFSGTKTPEYFIPDDWLEPL
jgi:hypothetical protein